MNACQQKNAGQKNEGDRQMKALRPLTVLFLIVSPMAVVAQTPATSTIHGAVSDAQGGRVVAALVTLTEVATGAERSAVTDAEGRYGFYALPPGRFKIRIEAPGFRPAEVSEINAELTKVTTVGVRLEVGEVLDTQVVTAGRALLQTADAAVGGVFSVESLRRLPNFTRQANRLFTLQAAAISTGEFAGARQDQNTVTLDGVDVSDHARGEAGRTVIPAPLETIEELRGIVANANATFGRSSGAQLTLVTRSGSSEFHGGAYLFHQNHALAANSWTNNRLGVKRPFLLDNRFGATFGGPLKPERTFFFISYEGRRHPDSATVTRLAPTADFRAGTLKILYGSVLITKDPATIKAEDPRGLGVNPKVLEYLRLYPLPNDFTRGDGHVYAGFTFAVPTSESDDFGLLRLDHRFNGHWQASVKFAANRHLTSDARQVSLLSQSAVASAPQRPRNAVASLTGNFSSGLTNEARFSWLRDRLDFESLPPRDFIGLNLPIRFSFFDQLVDSDSQRARRQFRHLDIYQWSDTLTWVRGGHNIQAGAHIRRIRSTDFRDDKVYNALTTPVAEIGDASPIYVAGAQRPTSLVPIVSSLVTLTRMLRGEVGQIPALFARDANLNLLPPGAGLLTESMMHAWEFYFSDTWRWRPSLTLTWGLTYNWQSPPVEDSDKQTVLTYRDSGRLVDYRSYLEQKRNAALQGEDWNPDLAFIPVRQAGRRAAFDPDYTNLSPRLSLAWNPAPREGWLAKLMGEYRTALRGGYSLVFDRINTVQTITIPTLGVGFSQTHALISPRNAAGQAFRIGIDGPLPLPSVPARLDAPIVPARTLEEIVSLTIDPKIRVPRNHIVDFTIQRELPGQMSLEAGWIGRFGRRLYANGNLNSTPFMRTDPQSGQSFAQAYDALVAARLANRPLPTQPYFENLYGAGTTSRFFTTLSRVSFFQQFKLDLCVQRRGDGRDLGLLCSAAQGPILTNLQVQDLWVRNSTARSNYHALFLSLQRRVAGGLILDLNYTLSKSLDNAPGLTQNDLTPYQSSFDPDIDYTPSPFDIRHLFNATFVYSLPFGSRISSGDRRLNRVIGGWFVAGVFTAQSGLPLTVIAGSDGFGGSSVHDTSTGAIPLQNSLYDKGAHRITVKQGGVGSNGNSSSKGSGLNLFADPELVFNNFRPALLSQDRRHGRGALRGLARWNLDWTIGKETKLTERVRFTISCDFFNLFNHIIFNNPPLSLNSPKEFGALSSQFNSPRRVQLGARFDF